MTEPLTPAQLLRHVREAGGGAAMRNLPPVVMAFGMAQGASTDDPDWMYTPSMTVSPAVHPILSALMDFHHATRRGRATWQIGLGEDTRQTAIGALLDAAYPGTVWWKDSLVTPGGKPRHLGQVTQRNALWRRAQHHLVPAEFTADRCERHENPYRLPHVVYPLYRSDHPARFGIISLNHAYGSVYVNVHTTPDLRLPEEMGIDLHELLLDRWAVGKAYCDPVQVYPAQALAIAEWATSVGLDVYDSDGSDALVKFQTTAAHSVVAWPRRGRPAQATVAVGREAPAQIRQRLLGNTEFLPWRSALITTTHSTPLADSLQGVRDVTRHVHPAVLDAAAMVKASPVEDDRLREYQRSAVGLHLSTTFGYVNACSPGLGKTIMVLAATRLRAARIPSYRGLVVAEANVRAQWCEEAETWFPEAIVHRVESRRDAAALAEVLDTAGPFPVLVVTSYALASSVMEHLNEVEPSDGGRDPVEVVNDTAETPALVSAPQGENEAAEPADLLQLLAEILTNDPVPAPAPVEGAGGQGPDEPEAVSLGSVLLSQYWHDLVADEAVTLRDVSSKQSKALWHLREQSQVAVALTGTPINRGINDLGSLISWVRGDRKLFHGAKLETQFDLSLDSDLEEFSQALGPLLFRRDKSELGSDLPGTVPVVMELDPSGPERALANAARNELKRAYDELVNWLAAVAEEHENSPEYVAAKEALKEARSAWLGGTTLARMAASDPAALLTARGAGAALLASQGLVAAATAEPGTKHTAVVADVLDRIGRGERVLIFTEFATVARGLIDSLDVSGVRVGEVIGGGGARRDRHIAAFRRGDLDVLVCTSAGERGLNLQTATTLVHYDLPWTPEGVIQRMGRVERIGATADTIQTVFWVMRGTIEERVLSVVVARAGQMMRALDSSRGVDVRDSDVGRALGSLATVARADEVNSKDAALLRITRELLAA